MRFTKKAIESLSEELTDLSVAPNSIPSVIAELRGGSKHLSLSNADRTIVIIKAGEEDEEDRNNVLREIANGAYLTYTF